MFHPCLPLRYLSPVPGGRAIGLPANAVGRCGLSGAAHSPSRPLDGLGWASRLSPTGAMVIPITHGSLSREKTSSDSFARHPAGVLAVATRRARRSLSPPERVTKFPPDRGRLLPRQVSERRIFPRQHDPLTFSQLRLRQNRYNP